jgi:hypothetical protein
VQHPAAGCCLTQGWQLWLTALHVQTTAAGGAAAPNPPTSTRTHTWTPTSTPTCAPPSAPRAR